MLDDKQIERLPAEAQGILRMARSVTDSGTHTSTAAWKGDVGRLCEALAEALERADVAERARDRLREALSMSPTKLAQMFHETYERLAPQWDYKTREDSAVPWEQVPLINRRLMVALASEVLATLKPTEESGGKQDNA